MSQSAKTRIVKSTLTQSKRTFSHNRHSRQISKNNSSHHNHSSTKSQRSTTQTQQHDNNDILFNPMCVNQRLFGSRDKSINDNTHSQFITEQLITLLLNPKSLNSSPQTLNILNPLTKLIVNGFTRNGMTPPLQTLKKTQKHTILSQSLNILKTLPNPPSKPTSLWSVHNTVQNSHPLSNIHHNTTLFSSTQKSSFFSSTQKSLFSSTQESSFLPLTTQKSSLPSTLKSHFSSLKPSVTPTSILLGATSYGLSQPSVGKTPYGQFDILKDLGLPETPSLDQFDTITSQSATKEKTLDEWLEADAVLKLNQIRRRAILEEAALKDLKDSMSFQEQMEYEMKTGGLRDGNAKKLEEKNGNHSFANSLQNDVHSTASQSSGVDNGLSDEESRALENWLRDRDAHSVVIGYLTDDIANFFKSFLFTVDDLSMVIDDALFYLPKLLPHYFITPFLLNLMCAVLPSNPFPKALPMLSNPLQFILPRFLYNPLQFISKRVIRSGNIMVDMRCFYNITMVLSSLTSFLSYTICKKFPQIYKKCGHYLLYPFGWFLHHYGDTQLTTHVIKSSIDYEEHLRMKSYHEKYGTAPTPINASTQKYYDAHVKPRHGTDTYQDQSDGKLKHQNDRYYQGGSYYEEIPNQNNNGILDSVTQFGADKMHDWGKWWSGEEHREEVESQRKFGGFNSSPSATSVGEQFQALPRNPSQSSQNSGKFQNSSQNYSHSQPIQQPQDQLDVGDYNQFAQYNSNPQSPGYIPPRLRQRQQQSMNLQG